MNLIELPGPRSFPTRLRLWGGQGGRRPLVRWVVVGVGLGAYAAIFLPVYRALGPAVAAFGIFPVALCGALLGPGWGALSGLVLTALNFALFQVAGGPVQGVVQAGLAFGLIGAVVGRQQMLGRALERQRDELQQVLLREREVSRQLESHKGQLARAMAVARLGSWEWDIRTNRISCSAEFYQLIGLSPEDYGAAFDQSYQDSLLLIHPEDRELFDREVQTALRERKARQFEYRLIRPDGSIMFLLGWGEPVLDERGEVVRMVGTTQDITTLKEFQARLQLTDRMASVGTLAGGVAHEINNPLAYVISNLNFIADELTEQAGRDPSGGCAPLLEAAREALEGANRVRVIVRDLKTFSRVESETRGPVDLGRAINLAVSMTGNEIRHRARLVKELGEVPRVLANDSRLGQVVVNLLVNAAQAIPEGHSDENEIRISTRLAGEGRVVIEVRDTGCGIRPELLGRIFDPFFTTKPVGQGTGLGLSISHGIVKAFGGEIQVESEVGRGSTFRVVLPTAEEATPQPAQPPPLAPACPRGRVLVVDDEPMVGAGLRRILGLDHDVEVATSGQEALRRLDLGERFDVILCDVMMPEMTGMEFYQELDRVAPGQLPKVVLMTGGAFTAGARHFLEQVPNPVLEKPLEPEVLCSVIRDRVCSGRAEPLEPTH